MRALSCTVYPILLCHGLVSSTRRGLLVVKQIERPLNLLRATHLFLLQFCQASLNIGPVNQKVFLFGLSSTRSKSSVVNGAIGYFKELFVFSMSLRLRAQQVRTQPTMNAP